MLVLVKNSIFLSISQYFSLENIYWLYYNKTSRRTSLLYILLFFLLERKWTIRPKFIFLFIDLFINQWLRTDLMSDLYWLSKLSSPTSIKLEFYYCMFIFSWDWFHWFTSFDSTQFTTIQYKMTISSWSYENGQMTWSLGQQCK